MIGVTPDSSDNVNKGNNSHCRTAAPKNFAQRPTAMNKEVPLLSLTREPVHLDASLQLAAASAALRKPS